MTSFAFIFGVLPLATASSAGSGAQNALGTSVIGGMLASAILAVLFVPLFYVLIGRVFPQLPLNEEAAAKTLAQHPDKA